MRNSQWTRFTIDYLNSNKQMQLTRLHKRRSQVRASDSFKEPYFPQRQLKIDIMTHKKLLNQIKQVRLKEWIWFVKRLEKALILKATSSQIVLIKSDANNFNSCSLSLKCSYLTKIQLLYRNLFWPKVKGFSNEFAKIDFQFQDLLGFFQVKNRFISLILTHSPNFLRSSRATCPCSLFRLSKKHLPASKSCSTGGQLISSSNNLSCISSLS